MISLHPRTTQSQPEPRLEVISRSATGAPQTYRVNRGQTQRRSVAAAYRRLALTILELDVATVAARLANQRESIQRESIQQAS